ncbi:sugar phosphate nucleotidyltransferase [Planctomycetaceae bacterium SH139]
MLVKKAVVTSAAPNQNTLPLQRLVDRDGCEKTALQMIVEEVEAAGVEEIAVIIQPGDAAAYAKAAGAHLGLLRFIEQPAPLGYGDALLRAQEFTAGEPFLHLVGDHLYLSGDQRRCAQQLIEVATEFDCAVSAVQATRENRLPLFGVVSGTHLPRRDRLYEVTRAIEKPTPTQAEQELLTAGLRAGYYLGFFGMHVLTPAVLEILAELQARPDSSPATLSDAVSNLIHRERYLALSIDGTRYNIGVKYGLLIAQLAFGLAGADRDPILTELLELMATRQMGGGHA